MCAREVTKWFNARFLAKNSHTWGIELQISQKTPSIFLCFASRLNRAVHCAPAVSPVPTNVRSSPTPAVLWMDMIIGFTFVEGNMLKGIIKLIL
jgi:hypothetical protein